MIVAALPSPSASGHAALRPLLLLSTLALLGGGAPAAAAGALPFAAHRGPASLDAAMPAPERTPAAAAGASLPVSHCLDDGSPGSLREVIAQAPEGATIDLSGLTCDRIELDAQTLSITQNDLLIEGNPDLRIAIDGAAAVRVVNHQGTGVLQLAHIDLINGSTTTGATNLRFGGCLQSMGSLVLDHVSVRNCYARTAWGGAVHVEGALTMIDSEVVDSSLLGTGFFHYGGGVSVFGGDTRLVRSRVLRNTLDANFTFDIWTLYGAGIYARHRILLEDSEVSDNVGYGMMGQGGGIFALGGGQILRSRIVGNTITNREGGNHEPASTFGGGIAFGDSGFDTGGVGTEIRDSVVADNVVYGAGGGLALQQGSTPVEHTVFNTTVSGNRALIGGGAHLVGSVRLFNTTIAFNQAESDGGVGGIDGGLHAVHPVVVDGPAHETELQSVLVAGNIAGPAGGLLPSDLGAGITAPAGTPVDVIGGNNLIVSLGANIAVPADTLFDDPQLLPLADNGGDTLTLALSEDSPAIDAGNNLAGLAHDQRGPGFGRSVGQADIGAYEVQEASIFRDGFESLDN